MALTEIGEMGTNAAQAVTQEALGRLNPKRVILTGICAGFPEAGVNFGDVLVPYRVVPYELAKVTESSGISRWAPWNLLSSLLRYIRVTSRVEYEHRGMPRPVSHGLWHAANMLGRDKTNEWYSEIKEQRPDGSEDAPEVYSDSSSVLGSGEKVVATRFAEARKWILQHYAHQAIGLEMESYGVLIACNVRETPFLVIKACQDPATRLKDSSQEKDSWRVYAAQAAATFTVALIKRFELQDSALRTGHMKEVVRIAQIFERDAPQPLFSYRVSRSESYALLKQRVFYAASQDLEVLIPNDAAPRIVLHGGAGTGKTRIIKSLMKSLIDGGLCPLRVDLRKYSH